MYTAYSFAIRLSICEQHSTTKKVQLLKSTVQLQKSTVHSLKLLAPQKQQSSSTQSHSEILNQAGHH